MSAQKAGETGRGGVMKSLSNSVKESDLFNKNEEPLKDLDREVTEADWLF